MSSKRESIISKLKTELAEITVANGYNTTVKLVTRNNFKDLESLTFDKVPAIFIMPEDENIIKLSNLEYQSNWTLSLGVILKIKKDISTEALISIAVENIIEDIKKKLATETYVNYSFNTYCVRNIDITRVESYTDTNIGFGGVVMQLLIIYDYNYLSP